MSLRQAERLPTVGHRDGGDGACLQEVIERPANVRLVIHNQDVAYCVLDRHSTPSLSTWEPHGERGTLTLDTLHLDDAKMLLHDRITD